MSAVITCHLSFAARAATIMTEVVLTVGEDTSSYTDLSCMLPPATRRALSLSNAPEDVNFSLRNMDERIIDLRCRISPREMFLGRNNADDLITRTSFDSESNIKVDIDQGLDDVIIYHALDTVDGIEAKAKAGEENEEQTSAERARSGMISDSTYNVSSQPYRALLSFTTKEPSDIGKFE
jgi:hypothetical protein